MNNVDGRHALFLAQRHRPIVYQAVRKLFDVPTRIEFGPFRPTGRPVTYYWIRTDAQFYYCGYAWYHWKDWTACPPGMLVGGEHRHDFEGAVVRVPYYLPHHRPPDSELSVITTYHHEWKRGRASGLWFVFIHAGSHAVEPCGATPPDGNCLIVHDCEWISLDDMGFTEWETTKEEFNHNSVSMPDQWSDRGEHRGALWNEPGSVF